MGVDPSSASPAVAPRRPELLADLQIDQTVTAPLGGLNYHSPHYQNIGKQFHKLLVEHASLTTTSNILDIGCGTGRLTNQLHGFLTGNYCGFDVHSGFIDYCRTTFTKPNFRFDRFDLYHDEYNPNGTINPTTFDFPYQAKSFDLVVAIAVFNHFNTAWVCQYVRQVSRMLRPKGIFFGTALLLNQQSMEFANTRVKPPYQFGHRTAESWHDFAARPLFNVAQPEEAIRRVFIKSNMMIREPIRYGEWCQSRVALAGPDIIIAQKN